MYSPTPPAQLVAEAGDGSPDHRVVRPHRLQPVAVAERHQVAAHGVAGRQDPRVAAPDRGGHLARFRAAEAEHHLHAVAVDGGDGALDRGGPGGVGGGGKEEAHDPK
jgi:hypothetical protein